MPSMERIKFVVGSAYQQIADLQPLPTYVASAGGTLVSSFMYGTFLNVGTGAGLLQNTSFLTRVGVQVKALNANTGICYVGVDSNITATGSTRGFELNANDGLLIPIDNLNRLHIIANVTSQNLTWVAA